MCVCVCVCVCLAGVGKENTLGRRPWAFTTDRVTAGGGGRERERESREGPRGIEFDGKRKNVRGAGRGGGLE